MPRPERRRRASRLRRARVPRVPLVRRAGPRLAARVRCGGCAFAARLRGRRRAPTIWGFANLPRLSFLRATRSAFVL